MSTDNKTSNQKLWHLYCVETKQRLTDLSEEEALSHVKALTDSEWAQWFAWTLGDKDWVPLQECQLFKNSRNRRRFPRVDIRVMVTIVTGYQRFQTYSRDISMGGILLDRELPFTPTKDRVRVILKYADVTGQTIEFSARLIMDRKRPIRLEFISAEEHFKKRLYQWVDLALKRQKEDAA